MENVAILGDIVGFVCFLAAAVLLASTPTRPEREYTPALKWFLVSAFLVYVYSTGADIAEQFKLTHLPDYFEGYVETLFPVLTLCAVFAAYSAQQVTDVLRSQRALANAHELMTDIMDAAPAGIMFVDTAGRVSFANDAAKETLELSEDPETGRVTVPGWTVSAAGGPAADDFSALVSDVARGREPVSVLWHDGRRIDLRVSSEPLRDATGGVGGVVLTFERPITSSDT
ncbi:MAG: PAS domain-containing protein [Coriobacteriia bacterium]